MENFLTWDVLLTFGGCVAGTVLLTEWLKRIFKNVPTQIVSFVIALAILIVGHIATGTFAWAELPLSLINAVAVAFTANGGYDAIERIFGGAHEAGTDGDILVNDDEAGNVFIYTNREPKEFEEGQQVIFTVKHTSQEKQSL
jgi:hypothetical protein